MQRQNTPVSNRGQREPGLRPYSEALDGLVERIDQERRFPLVRFRERLPDGHVAVEFFDRARYPEGDDPDYDFYLRDMRQALEWVRQVAPKSWITKRHIEVFAILALREFPEGATTWALQNAPTIDPTSRHVLLCLAVHAANGSSSGYADDELLIRATHLKPRTVRRKLNLLLGIGLVTKAVDASGCAVWRIAMSGMGSEGAK